MTELNTVTDEETEAQGGSLAGLKVTQLAGKEVAGLGSRTA